MSAAEIGQEGPEGEDGPWAEGWEVRSRTVADPFTHPTPTAALAPPAAPSTDAGEGNGNGL